MSEEAFKEWIEKQPNGGNYLEFQQSKIDKFEAQLKERDKLLKEAIVLLNYFKDEYEIEIELLRRPEIKELSE